MLERLEEGMLLDIKKEMQDIACQLESIKNYDTVGFVSQLKYLVGQIYFFYNHLVPKQGNDESRTFYKVKVRPKEGQIAYFNLTRGFPKELYDGHFCYILKDFKSKFIIIPTTSVKSNSAECNPNYELDIEDHTKTSKSRLHIDDIRVADIQRLNPTKGIFDVITDREIILAAIKNKLFD